jgi:hypothetical protein
MKFTGFLLADSLLLSVRAKVLADAGPRGVLFQPTWWISRVGLFSRPTADAFASRVYSRNTELLGRDRFCGNQLDVLVGVAGSIGRSGLAAPGT